MRLSQSQQTALEMLRHGEQPRNYNTVQALLKRGLIEIDKQWVSSYQVDAQRNRIPGTEVRVTEYRVKG